MVEDDRRAAGGEAVANGDDVADFEGGAAASIDSAIETWGRLDVLVNNAGFVRDRMFVSTSEEEWDAVIRVHLTRALRADAPRRASTGASARRRGAAVDARIINTSSGAGLLGSVGQGAYSAAKAGHRRAHARPGRGARALRRHGERDRPGRAHADDGGGLRRDDEEARVGGFDAMAPENVAPLVAWLASTDSKGVTGRVFEIAGGRVSVAEGWREGPSVDRGAALGRRRDRRRRARAPRAGATPR